MAHDPQQSPAGPLPPGGDPDPRWLDRPGSVHKLIVVTIVLCVIVACADFFYHKHAHPEFTGFTAFHAFYGFFSYVGLVLVAAQLRKVLMRPEDYYD